MSCNPRRTTSARPCGYAIICAWYCPEIALILWSSPYLFFSCAQCHCLQAQVHQIKAYLCFLVAGALISFGKMRGYILCRPLIFKLHRAKNSRQSLIFADGYIGTFPYVKSSSPFFHPRATTPHPPRPPRTVRPHCAKCFWHVLATCVRGLGYFLRGRRYLFSSAALRRRARHFPPFFRVLR